MKKRFLALLTVLFLAAPLMLSAGWNMTEKERRAQNDRLNAELDRYTKGT